MGDAFAVPFILSWLQLISNTVEPLVSDHQKCKDLVVAYMRQSLTTIEPEGFSSKKKCGHIYFREENLLHAISKLRHLHFHIVPKVLRIF